ncbi:squalene synthase HpnD, partial [Escherichia coli]
MSATASPIPGETAEAPALPAAGSSFYTAMRLLPK